MPAASQNSTDSQPSSSQNQEWDLIVVGTGVGGATLGYAMARAGYRVLFLEKGRASLGQDLRGQYAEAFFQPPGPASPAYRDPLARAGRCQETLLDRCYAPEGRRFVPFIGIGAGGSSALYGMAMERFFPEDFTPCAFYPQATGTNLADWPVAYEELQPYYHQAEELYRVRGKGDPLRGNEAFGYRPVPDLHPANQELFEFFESKGLHPYHLPMACEYVPGCQGCQGYLCDKGCKNDASRACLSVALAEHGAHLYENCEVLSLSASDGRVSDIHCQWQGKTFSLHAKTVVLAAGALATPIILLRSHSAAFPQGLANASGLVGRNLMRHYVDLYAIFIREKEKISGNIKEIAFNDLYCQQGVKLGSVQSFGYMPPPDVIVELLQQNMRDGPLSWLAYPFGGVKGALGWFLARLFSRTMILASVQEDLPYADNRITLGTMGEPVLEYKVRSQENDRITVFRDKLKALFSPYRFLVFKEAHNNERIAHVCGTCRFGDDPETSVLDRNNKAHELDNLYIVDSSFFPSSGGTNPALTIAANALRVAEHLKGKKNDD